MKDNLINIIPFDSFTESALNELKKTIHFLQRTSTEHHGELDPISRIAPLDSYKNKEGFNFIISLIVVAMHPG